MEKRQFNSMLKQYLVLRGFEKTAPNDYAISAKDGVTKFILRTPDQTQGFIIGAQFSDYREYTGTFSKAVMKNFEYESLLCFAKSRDYSEQNILSALDTVFAGMQPYLTQGKTAIREHIDQWVFGAFSDKIRNEILVCLGFSTMDPYSKECLLEQIGRMKNGGVLSFPLEEYISHKEYYDLYADHGGSIAVDEKVQQVRIHFSYATKTFCRIITESCDANTQSQITAYISERLESIGALDIYISPLVPYWKKPEQGELSFHFWSRTPLTDIQHLFADTWQDDTADAAWSNIQCPGTVFLWISQ